MNREQKEDNTDALRNKHIENAEEKAYHQWEEQNKKRQQLQVTVDASRKALIQKRKNDREQEKSVDRTVAELIKMRNQELDFMDAKDREENRQRLEQLKEYQVKQAQDRKAKAEKEFQEEMENVAKNTALLDEHDKKFYSYAEQAIKQWQDSGKNIKPLIMELKSYNKKIE